MSAGLLRIAGLAALLAGCAGTPAPSAAPAQVFAKQMELGRAYLRQGDLPRAKAKLQQALATQPDSAAALTSLGLAHQLEGEDALAERHFKAALAQAPDLAEARNNYGVYLLSRQRPAEAIAQLEAAASAPAYPNRGSALENLGRAQLLSGDRQAAIQAFEKAAAVNPAQQGALLELAELAYDNGAYADAQGYRLRLAAVARPTARSLWLCVRLARILADREEEAQCGRALGAFPASDEYRSYQESR